MRKLIAALLVAAMLVTLAPVALATSTGYLPLNLLEANWFPNSEQASWSKSTGKLSYITGQDTGVTMSLDSSKATSGEYTLTITGKFEVFEEHYYNAFSTSQLGSYDRMILIPYTINETNYNYGALMIDGTTFAYNYWKQIVGGMQYYLFFKPSQGGNTRTFKLSEVLTGRQVSLTVKYVDSTTATATSTEGMHLQPVSVSGNQANNVMAYNSNKSLRVDIAALTKEDCAAIQAGTSNLTIKVKAMKTATTAFAPFSKVVNEPVNISAGVTGSVSLAGSTRVTGFVNNDYMLDADSCFFINMVDLLHPLAKESLINDYNSRMGGSRLRFTITESGVASTFDVDFLWQKVERGDNAILTIDETIEVKVGDTRQINYTVKNPSGFGSAVTWRVLNNNGVVVQNNNSITGLKVGTVYVIATAGTDERFVTVKVVNEYSGTATQKPSTPSSTQTPTGNNQYIVTASSLRIRAGSGTSHKQVGSLKRGQVVTVLEELTNGWCKIKYGTITGYVSGQYLAQD